MKDEHVEVSCGYKQFDLLGIYSFDLFCVNLFEAKKYIANI